MSETYRQRIKRMQNEALQCRTENGRNAIDVRYGLMNNGGFYHIHLSPDGTLEEFERSQRINEMLNV